MRNSSIFLLAAVFMLPSYSVQSNEVVTYELNYEGDYVIEYEGVNDNGEAVKKKFIYEPPTKIEPEVLSVFKRNESKGFDYSYHVRNGKMAKQEIRIIKIEGVIPDAPLEPVLGSSLRRFDWDKELDLMPRYMEISNILDASVMTPKGWDGGGDLDEDSLGVIVTWSPDYVYNNNGIIPGRSVSGFGVSSPDLPGLGYMSMKGFTDTVRMPADAGDGLWYFMEEVSPKYSRVKTLVALPRIAVPEAFDAYTLLSSIMQHVQDLHEQQLMDTELLQELQSVFEEVSKNENDAGIRKAVKDLRNTLHRYANTLDADNKERHLLVKVLDFDFQYLERRIAPGAH